MLIGIIGGPNKGKSTMFSALTMNDVAIADYPFTTIKPNLGVAYATAECAEKHFGVKCKPRNSLCLNGTRLIPINVTDVAGLVEGAHSGKGMGNQFLNDLSGADALLLVVDASGLTDLNGNAAQGQDPAAEAEIVIREIALWLAGIIRASIQKLRLRQDSVPALSELLSGLKVRPEDIDYAITKNSLTSLKAWSESDIYAFSATLLQRAKPLLVVANKFDSPESKQNLARLQERFGSGATWCMAAFELALRKAARAGIISYSPGDTDFRLLKETLSPEQRHGLDFIRSAMAGRGTNVQNVINKATFELLDNIVVYPVEDENRLSDHSGNVLPDSVLLKRGSTAQDLANRIHTDLGKGMLYAIDAKTKMRISKDHVLKDGDVIKIVSTAR